MNKSHPPGHMTPVEMADQPEMTPEDKTPRLAPLESAQNGNAAQLTPKLRPIEKSSDTAVVVTTSNGLPSKKGAGSSSDAESKDGKDDEEEKKDEPMVGVFEVVSDITEDLIK